MGNTIERMAFYPPDPPGELPKSRTLWLGNIHGDQIPIVYYHQKESSHVIVFSHGNATDLGQMAPFYKHMAKTLKISVVGYEYLGYGKCISGDDEAFNGLSYSQSSQGNLHPSEKGCVRALKTVYTYLTEERKIPSRKIVLMGQSIGTGPTVTVGSQLPVGGVILVSPFRSAGRIVTETSFIRPLDIFDNQRKIQDIEAPVLIIHGAMDSVVPISHGQLLARKIIGTEAEYPPTWISSGTHDNMFDYDQFWVALRTYFDYLFYNKI